MHFCEFIFDLESILIRKNGEVKICRPIVDFICEKYNRCYIITKLSPERVNKVTCMINMEDRIYYLQEQKYISNNKKDITDVTARMLEKKSEKIVVAVGKSIIEALPLKKGDVKIMFDVRDVISQSILECVDYAIYSEEKLVEFLYKLDEDITRR